MSEFAGQRPPQFASTFPDEAAAEDALAALLRPREAALDNWLGSSQRRVSFTGDIGRPAGRIVNEFDQAWDSSWVHAVLTQDQDAPDGWWLLTGYPTHARTGRETDIPTPALDHLVGAYFHQDWYDDLGDSDRVIRAFVGGSPDLAPALPAEISAVLDAVPDDLLLQRHLVDLGCEFRAYPEEGGPRAWLRHVAQLVA